VIAVYGYHGTSIERAASIMEEGYRISRNDYDWLGDGVYFWQDAPQRAWEWATQHHQSQAAVVGSLIQLNDCIDLLDPRWARFLTETYDLFWHSSSDLAGRCRGRQPALTGWIARSSTTRSASSPTKA